MNYLTAFKPENPSRKSEFFSRGSEDGGLTPLISYISGDRFFINAAAIEKFGMRHFRGINFYHDRDRNRILFQPVFNPTENSYLLGYTGVAKGCGEAVLSVKVFLEHFNIDTELLKDVSISLYEENGFIVMDIPQYEDED